LIRETNAFIRFAYTRENTIARRSYVYEFNPIETFAFALQCPGGIATRHLPGFTADEVPPSLMALSVEVADRLGLKQGRVLFNVGRYFERCGPIMPHYDGELFDYEIEPGVRNHVRSGIRPREVAILTLRDETRTGGTRLHDASGEVISPPVQVGDLLCFDNLLYQHGVPDPERATGTRGDESMPARWIRYTLGWRALDENCFDWRDGEPLRPIGYDEAIGLHERFLREQWPVQMATDVARGTFPYPELRS
jgi:hypothetical protein